METIGPVDSDNIDRFCPDLGHRCKDRAQSWGRCKHQLPERIFYLDLLDRQVQWGWQPWSITNRFMFCCAQHSRAMQIKHFDSDNYWAVTWTAAGCAHPSVNNRLACIQHKANLSDHCRLWTLVFGHSHTHRHNVRNLKLVGTLEEEEKITYSRHILSVRASVLLDNWYVTKKRKATTVVRFISASSQRLPEASSSLSTTRRAKLVLYAPTCVLFSRTKSELTEDVILKKKKKKLLPQHKKSITSPSNVTCTPIYRLTD